jgi:3-oxoacyl-[acyl-carrier protein] reductase
VGNSSIIPTFCNNPKPITWNIQGHDFEMGEKLDLTNLEEIKRLTKLVEAHSDRPLNITLIHLAAIKIDELAVFVNEDNWDKVFDVNTKGAFFLTQSLLPIMLKEKWGRIIFITSSGLCDIGTSTYSASKGALIFLSKTLAREYGGHGITSNVIQLGYYRTGLWDKLKEEKQIELLSQIPSKELGNTKNIVNAIDMIIKSDYINGSEVIIDGGI